MFFLHCLQNALKSLEAVDFGLEAVRDVQKLITALEQEV